MPTLDAAPAMTRPVPHVAEIRLQRPAAANRLTPDDLATIGRYLADIERDGDVRVLILSAEGRHFCGGFDLAALASPARNETNRRQSDQENEFERLANQLAAARPLVIAALNGAVVGGATDIALAADLRIGATTASLMMPAARIGLPLYASALDRYVARFGIDMAKRLIFLGQTLRADELLQLGFLTDVVAPDQLDARVRAIAGDLAQLPAAPAQAMKAALNALASGARPTPEMRSQLNATFDAGVIRARIADRPAKSKSN